MAREEEGMRKRKSYERERKREVMREKVNECISYIISGLGSLAVGSKLKL